MVSIGNYVLPEDATAVRVRTREVLSRVRKEIEINTILRGYGSLEELEQDLEALEGELEKLDRREVMLSLQEGRFYQGWRKDCRRMVEPKHCVAALDMLILTDDRFERSLVEHHRALTIAASGCGLLIEQAGNGEAFIRARLTASGDLVRPRLSDGTRVLIYEGDLAAGEQLVIDGQAGTVRDGDGVNRLHSITGDFPMLSPGENLLVYEDAASSSHSGLLEVWYRDLWV
jgi:hypothetical protein